MSNFDYYLEDIATRVSCPNDSDAYDDFCAVKDYVLHIMRTENSYFDQICQKVIRFGSTSHDIRLYDDDEFDVLLELRFPNYSRIVQRTDKQRPGFVFLDFSDACCDSMTANYLANNQRCYLNRNNLKKWLHNIFKNALESNGIVLSTENETYILSYAWRGITYTIYAKSETRDFSIDFVPAVKIVRPNSGTWHAIPKNEQGPSNNAFTFMISNAQAEWQHVQRCGQSLRDALRLLQALRDSKQLYQLPCYHFVTLAIWLARRIGHANLCNMSVSEIFLMLLSDLCDAFIDNHLPYAWDSEMNLLASFDFMDISDYTEALCSAYNVLKTYPYQGKLSFGRCFSHFK